MFFNKFDFISPYITFYYKNRKRHLSPLGGFLTIILFILSIYLTINYYMNKIFPNCSSLIMYRNFEVDKTLNYFNESGLFHFIWIYKNENIISTNELKLNTIKNGIIRIFMTYSYNNYQYNSSNLQDNDHWVYDTCHQYANKDDMKYDYSFSSCIRYYYNSIHKKYYSIHDNENFKWPNIPDNLTDIDNAFYTTFIEKCSNQSVLNDIMGECYPEEKINEYLLYFNNIFISFINNKIEIKDQKNPIKAYSHRIYNKFDQYFYTHELDFVPFNYEETKRLFHKYKYNSFMFDGKKTTKLYKNGNDRLLFAYVFNFKKYINEFRKQDNYILSTLHYVGGIIIVIYFIFYLLNYFLNERIEVRNFQNFLNDRSNLIHRHINYDRSKIYSLKSNIYTNISNEGFDNYNSFKSTYFSNLLKKDLSTIYNYNINNNNSKINDNNLIIERPKLEDKDKDKDKNKDIEKEKDQNKDIEKEKEKLKKNDNIIIINNGTFMNEGTVNGSSNNKLNISLKNTFEKRKTIKGNNTIKEEYSYNKTLTYNKKQKERRSTMNRSSIVNPKRTKNLIHSFTNYKIFDDDISDKNESKQKINDTSSINLLNSVNKTKNLFKNSNYHFIPKKDLLSLNYKRNSESVYTNHFQKIHKKIKILPKENLSQKDFKSLLNQQTENSKPTFSKKNNNKIIIKDTHSYNFSPTNDFAKKRRQSHQARNTFKYDKYDKDNVSDKIKNHNNNGKRKTGIFQVNPDIQKERHLSLFSGNSNVFNNNNRTFNLYPWDNSSQVNLSKNLMEHYKRVAPLHKFMGKKVDKEMISPGSESQSKNQKIDRKKSIKPEHSAKPGNKFSKIVQNIKWTPLIIFNYLCICRKSKSNGINLLNILRHKLLSEEYLYILHFNMLVFKQKFGCKSNLEKMSLLEELYNDY